MPRVYYCVLKEKHNEQYAADAIEALNYRAGQLGYQRLSMKSNRTDEARNVVCEAFRQYAKEPDDCLVMLDQDHVHPLHIIEELVNSNLPVVSALAFRRGIPYFPCVFFRNSVGTLCHPIEWQQSIYRVDATGTAAIAIRRSVFDTLEQKGVPTPWFQYTYPQGKIHPSEDMYFSRCCELASVPVYCDFRLITPHVTTGTIQDDTWRHWLADNPDFGDIKEKIIPQPHADRILKETL